MELLICYNTYEWIIPKTWLLSGQSDVPSSKKLARIKGHNLIIINYFILVYYSMIILMIMFIICQMGDLKAWLRYGSGSIMCVQARRQFGSRIGIRPRFLKRFIILTRWVQSLFIIIIALVILNLINGPGMIIFVNTISLDLLRLL